MQISFSRFEVAAFMLAAVALPASGFLAGAVVASRSAPLDSELATAQELSGDKDARWIAYGCGDDGATLVTRDMPNPLECRETRRLSDSASFPAPGKAS
jgi:hypothetical protein